MNERAVRLYKRIQKLNGRAELSSEERVWVLEMLNRAKQVFSTTQKKEIDRLMEKIGEPCR